MKQQAAALFLLATACCSPPAQPTVLPAPKVVLLENDETGGRGSGVVIRDDWVLTAAHCLPMTTANGLPIAESFAHPFEDLALLRVPGIKGSVVFGELPDTFDPVSAYGWALGRQLQRTDGYAGQLWGEMSAPVIFGCSGGAVVNARGELIGIIITVGAAFTPMGDSYAVPCVAGYTPLDAVNRGWISYIVNP